MLAVLANFGQEDPDAALKTIANQIIQTSSGDFAKRRHINQLRILAQLRNFKLQNLYNMDSLKGVFSNEKDILYQIGEIEGRDRGMKEATQKTKAAFIKSLLLNTDFSMTKIASLVDVSVYAVRKIRKTLH